MKKVTIFSIFILLVSFPLFSQVMSPETVGTSGKKSQTPGLNYHINYSVASPVRGNYSSDTAGNYIITCGYPQSITGPDKFDIGSIPDMVVSGGNAIEFYIHSEELGDTAKLYMEVNYPVIGDIYFSGQTGYFLYIPNEKDNQEFTVTFSGYTTLGEDIQTITITPEIIITPVPGEFFGYTSGTFNVGENGSAYYNIPIQVTPGTAGLQPNLSIQYSSNSSNGILGVGWMIGGLSTISRSPMTYAQDNEIDGIDFDDKDRFNLDGERLIVASGSVYGGHESEYYTEQNNFSKITSFVEGGVVTKFVVKTKDGLTKIYGGTVNSRIRAQGKNDILFWSLSKVIDSKGNYIEITYYNDGFATGEYYPIEIKYTGNENTGLLPYASILFEYETRPDKCEDYLYGSKSKKTVRLTNLKVKYESTIVREYVFDYGNSNYSKLLEIQEFGVGGEENGEAFEPIKFKWMANELFNMVHFDNEIPSSQFNNNDITVITGEWNNDGKTDLLVYNKSTGNNYWKINNSDLDFTTYSEIIPHADIQGGEGLHWGDWNGDGFIDLMWWNKTTGVNKWYVRDPNQTLSFSEVSFTISTNELLNQDQLTCADFNGDGKTDILLWNKSNGYIKIIVFDIEVGGSSSILQAGNTEDVILCTSLSVGDWNNDGMSDIMAWNISNGKNFWYLNLGIGNNEVQFQDGGSPLPTNLVNENGTDIQFGDWNADGITDVMWYNHENGKNFWIINKGNLTREEIPDFDIIPKSYLKNDSAVIYIGDWNVDGYSDFMIHNYFSGVIKIFVNKGNFVFERNDNLIKSGILEKGAGFLFGDWNGTGHTGIGWYNKENGKNHWFVNAVKNSNLIESIYEGNGNVISIEYKPLTDTSVYQRENNPVFPEIDFISPMMVVSEHSVSNGNGGQNSFSYYYEGGKYHIQGRGFRGFKKSVSIDNQSGISNINIYERDYRFVGTNLKRSYQLLPSNDTISSIIFFNESNDGAPYFSYTARKTERKFELNGTLTSETSTEFEYDEFGNVTKIIIDYGNGYSDTTVNTFTNYITYSNNVLDKWLLGRLTHTYLSRVVPGQDAMTREVEFEYDLLSASPSGIMTKEIIEPDNPDLRFEKSYTHDSFGNVIISTTSAINDGEIENRVFTTTYTENGRFVNSSTNAVGHTEERVYEPLHGNLIQQTDANGINTYWQYDNFGRKVKEIRPDGTETIISYRWKNDLGTFNPPENAMYGIHTQNTGLQYSIKWYDMLNREVRTEIEGFDGTPIYIDMVYNDTDQLSQKSEPYFSGGSQLWTTYTYDLFDRLVAQTQPGDRTSAITYDGFTTINTNTLGHSKTEIKNEMNRTISVIDNNNNTINYEYDSQGNLKTITDPDGNQIAIEYDNLGRIISVNDPDMGIQEYSYNGFGEMVKEKDALNDSVIYIYDLLGRIEERIEPEGITNWVYDVQDHGIGKISNISSYENFNEEYLYDDIGRMLSKTYNIDGTPNQYSYTYNDIGKIENIIYPTGFALTYDYNTRGVLYKVSNTESDFLYYQIENVNARGQLEQFVLGNGLTTKQIFSENTGFLSQINTANETDTIQDLGFTFNKNGNLIQRSDIQRGLIETFEYDNLERLIASQVNSNPELTMQYNDIGNITFKSDVGFYTYGENGAGPHAVTSINGESIENANFITSLQGSIEYTSFKKAKEIVSENNKAVIEYYYNHNRKSIEYYQESQLVLSKSYIGSLLETEISGDTIKNIHLIKVNGTTIANHCFDNFDNENILFLHRDHLNSIQCISDTLGNIIQTLAFDPWGNRRDPDTWETIFTGIYTPTSRGFTGHEHMDLVDLINMNGRIYDPVIGRFTSPDPNIVDIYSLQNLNRYSYVENNPLSYNDPSGYFKISSVFSGFSSVINEIDNAAAKAANWVKEHKKEITIAAVAIAAGVATGGLASAAIYGTCMAGGFTGAVISGAAFGFGMTYTSARLSGASNNQSFKAGVKSAAISGVTAGATYGVGEAFGHATDFGNVVPKAIAHGTIQGASTEYQGGKFEHGFLSGAATSVSDLDILSTDNFAMSIAKSAVVGGTVSEMSGGTFANGAQSGAMVTIYNSWGDWFDSAIKKAADTYKYGNKGAEVGGFWGAVVGAGHVILNTETYQSHILNSNKKDFKTNGLNGVMHNTYKSSDGPVQTIQSELDAINKN